MNADIFIKDYLYTLCHVTCDEELINKLVKWELTYTVLATMFVFYIPAPYGRYRKQSLISIQANIAWMLQELPSLLVPLWLIGYSRATQIRSWVSCLLIGFFMLHYFQRSVVYPLLIRAGKPVPVEICLAAFIFCLFNGFLQGHSIISVTEYDSAWATDIRFLTGSVLFLCGMAVNLHSDHILHNLRRPGESGYRIPEGGMFEYVSGANYFGEMVEWVGFAVAAWTPPAAVFALFTVLFLGHRGQQHHRFYLHKFEDYPRNRKAIIPFIL